MTPGTDGGAQDQDHRGLLDRWDAVVRALAGRDRAHERAIPPDAPARLSVRMAALFDRLSRIAVPDFEDDETRSWDANTLNLVLLGLAAFQLLNAAGVVLFSADKYWSVPLNVAALIVILVSHWLMRRGRVYLASLAFIAGMWSVFAVMVTLSGGMHSAFTLTFAFLCVIAAVQLGPRAALATAGASTLLIVALIVAERLGHPPPRVFPNLPGRAELLYGILLVLFAGLLAIHSVRHALAKALESERQYRAMVEQAVDGILITDPTGRVLFSNPALRDMLGFRADEMLGLNLMNTYSPDERDEGAGRIGRLVGGERLRFERSIQRKDGSNIVVEVTASRLDDGRLQGIVRDESERARAEVALRESEERFQRLSAAAFEGIAISDEGVLVDVNARFAEMVGCEIAELWGRRILDFVAPEDHALVLRHVREASTEAYEHVAVRKDGSRLHVEVHGHTIPFHGRNLRVTAVRDMSEQYRSEEALRQSEEQFRTVFEGVRDVIFSASTQGVLTSLNAVFEELTGWTRADWVGKPFSGLLHPDDKPRAAALLQAVLLDVPSPTAQLRVRKRDGEYLVGEFRTSIQYKEGQVVGVLGIVRDVTSRLQLEGQLRQAQKMEAIGQLAGGVAHDFNNLLSVIIGWTGEALADLPPDSPVRSSLEEVLKAGQGAAELTKQLLTFSRQHVVTPTVFNVNDVVMEMDKMFRRLLGEDIEIVIRTDPELGVVKMDRGQLEQVLVNLAVNARDAMPTGGTLKITTRNVVLESRYPLLESDVAAGEYVVLAVSDSGTGMSDAVIARMFEPFYTTKASGKGTGLGLATSYGIVREAGGQITVHSELGRGTTMEVFLPRCLEAANAPARRREHAPRHGGETILVVEDEPGVRRVTVKMLESQGYRVVTASGGEEALRMLGEALEPLDLLLTDVVLGSGMSGPVLADRIRESRPDLRVLFVSGYAGDVTLRHGLMQGGTLLVQKPFSAETLGRMVRQVLDEG